MPTALYAQSGGVTATINASAQGVLETALGSRRYDRVFAARYGLTGLLQEELVDVGAEDPREVARIGLAPGAVFGSCRRKFVEHATLENGQSMMDRLFDVFEAHDVQAFFYNGGNDSMDTAHRVALAAAKRGYPLNVVGIPKTVDNDLEGCDHTPGYGSAAKYTAVALLEAARDLRAMAVDSTQVFVLESMGRHAGWLAAAGVLASLEQEDVPHLVLLPEVPFVDSLFLAAVERAVARHGMCTIVAAEALRGPNGDLLSTAGYSDAFGHVQLGKVGLFLERMMRTRLGLRVHTALPDYLQRSSRHLASATDWQESYDVGARAVYRALEGATGEMIAIVREDDRPYRVSYGSVPLADVAGKTRVFPTAWLGSDGFSVQAPFLTYAAPLIRGEAEVAWNQGLPRHPRLALPAVTTRLPALRFAHLAATATSTLAAS